MVNTQYELQMKKCAHASFREGACWEITQKGLKDAPTTDKYCSNILPDNIRLYKSTGFMEPKENDILITENCIKCEEDVLLPIGVFICSECEEKLQREKVKAKLVSMGIYK